MIRSNYPRVQRLKRVPLKKATVLLFLFNFVVGLLDYWNGDGVGRFGRVASLLYCLVVIGLWMFRPRVEIDAMPAVEFDMANGGAE